MTKQTKTQSTNPTTDTAETKPKTSKKQVMLDLLGRSGGVTITELEKATGWQQHSVRGALVNLKNKDKQPVESEKRDGTRYYLIKQAKEAKV